MLHPEQGDDPDRYETQVMPNPTRPGEGVVALKQRPNGDCWYLGETGCTIYGWRPFLCRIFDCRRFAAKLMSMPRARRRAIISAYPGVQEQIDVGLAKAKAQPL